MQKCLGLFGLAILLVSIADCTGQSNYSCGCCPSTVCATRTNPCSTNPDCDCLLMTMTGGGMCADTVVSCSTLDPCENDGVTCRTSNTICVNNTRCNRPVCFPIQRAGPQACPPVLGSIQITKFPSPTSTQLSTLASTTVSTSTLAPTTIKTSTLAPTTVSTSTLAPTTIKTSTLAPTTVSTSTLAPTTIKTSTVSLTTAKISNQTCSGGRCGTFTNNCSANSSCFCFKTSSNSSMCTLDFSCSAYTNCTSCPVTSVCLVETCCVEPKCVPRSLALGCTTPYVGRMFDVIQPRGLSLSSSSASGK